MSYRCGVFGKSFSDIGDTIKTKWKQVTDYVAVTNDATISGMISAWKSASPVQFLSDDSVVNILNDYNKALDSGADKFTTSSARWDSFTISINSNNSLNRIFSISNHIKDSISFSTHA